MLTDQSVFLFFVCSILSDLIVTGRRLKHLLVQKLLFRYFSYRSCVLFFHSLSRSCRPDILLTIYSLSCICYTFTSWSHNPVPSLAYCCLVFELIVVAIFNCFVCFNRYVATHRSTFLKSRRAEPVSMFLPRDQSGKLLIHTPKKPLKVVCIVNIYILFLFSFFGSVPLLFFS